MNIEHATITEFSENGYLLETDKGYGFYFKSSYVNEDGTEYEPSREELELFKKGYFPKSFNFNKIVIMNEAE